MALSPVIIPPARKKGGGLFGKIAGGLVGAVTGGLMSGGNPAGAVMGAVKGAATGASLGGMIGDSVKPPSAAQGQGTSLLDSSLKTEPGAQLDILNQGQDAVRSMGHISVDERQAAIDTLEEAKRKIDSLKPKPLTTGMA